MIHAVTLLLILLFAAPLAAQVPLAVLAGLLFVVAYNMGEWHEIPSLLKMTKADIAVWLATFALTVVADLTVAVEVGMVLAALLFIRRVAKTTSVARVTDDLIEEGRLHSLQGVAIPAYAAVFRIHGPFLFGATDKLPDIVDHLRRCRRSSSSACVTCRRWMPPACRRSRIFADQVRASGRTLLLVRRARAAGASDGARGVPRARRRREHPAERARAALKRARRYRDRAGSG